MDAKKKRPCLKIFFFFFWKKREAYTIRKKSTNLRRENTYLENSIKASDHKAMRGEVQKRILYQTGK